MMSGEAYRRGLQQFKDHNLDTAAGDSAVAGIDRAPTELLTKAKERLSSEPMREHGPLRSSLSEQTDHEAPRAPPRCAGVPPELGPR